MSPARVMVNTAAVLFVIGLAWLLVQVRTIIVILILAILLAAAIEPLVHRLRRRGFRRGQAILTVYAGILLTLIVSIYLIVPPLITQATGLVESIPAILENLRNQAIASDNRFIQTSVYRTILRLESAYREFSENPRIEGRTALGWFTTALGFLFASVTTMIVAFYWMTEKAIIKRLILGFFPLRHRDRAHSLWDTIEARLGGWTRGQLVLMLTIGVLSAIGYLLLGLDFWLPLGIFAGLTEIIPFIGPYIGGGAAVLVALTVSWQKALLVIGFVVLLQQLENAVLVPRVMRNAVGMTPLTVVVAVLVGGVVLGPIGSIIAIPVGAACQVLIADLLKQRQDEPDEASQAVSAQVAVPPALVSAPMGDGDGRAAVHGATAPGAVERRPPVATG
jgi:predicted PurR-regulated permease PerM